MTLRIVAVLLLKETTGRVTTECLAPVSTIKVMFWPPTFIMTMGSWGLRAGKPGPCQYESVPDKPTSFFLPVRFSTVVTGLWGFPSVGAFILPMPLLFAVSTQFPG